jgi:hypothetical protein
MANLEKKSFNNPDELKTPEKTNAAVVNFGIYLKLTDATVTRVFILRKSFIQQEVLYRF